MILQTKKLILSRMNLTLRSHMCTPSFIICSKQLKWLPTTMKMMHLTYAIVSCQSPQIYFIHGYKKILHHQQSQRSLRAPPLEQLRKSVKWQTKSCPTTAFSATYFGAIQLSGQNQAIHDKGNRFSNWLTACDRGRSSCISSSLQNNNAWLGQTDAHIGFRPTDDRS